MSRKDSVREAVMYGRQMGMDVAERLSVDERERAGTFDVWAPKDVFAHIAEWLSRDLKRLSAEDPLPSYAGEDIEELNRAIFDEYADWSWDQVFSFYTETFDGTLALLESLDDAGLERERSYDDESTRSVWRIITGHSLMHVTPHFALVYERMDEKGPVATIQERSATVLLGVDNSPEWVGTLKYNLACHAATSGESGRAIELLRTALQHNPGLVEWSRKDPDLDSLREMTEFRKLYE